MPHEAKRLLAEIDALRAELAEHPIHNEHTIAYEGEGIAWDERLDDDDWLSGKAVNERIRRAHENAQLPKSAMAIVREVLHETTVKLEAAEAALRSPVTRAHAEWETMMELCWIEAQTAIAWNGTHRVLPDWDASRSKRNLAALLGEGA
jgi:hypothetical protein